MNEKSEWSESQKREQALLRRCREFVLGGPSSPGGGSKDILYLTPCGRWMRIYSGAIEYRDAAYEHIEVLSQINSRKAAALFDEYNWPRPAELERPAMATNAETEHFIPRNSLSTVLEGWANGWPPALEEKPTQVETVDSKEELGEIGALKACHRHILQALYRTGHRLTRDKLASKMRSLGFDDSDKTINAYAWKMRSEMGLLDNSSKERPRGFGLTDKGRRFAEYLEAQDA